MEHTLKTIKNLDLLIAKALKDKKYICILSGPRSGSTALADVIANKYSLHNYGEIHTAPEKRFKKPSVVCLTRFAQNQEPIEKFLKKDCFVIKLTRVTESLQCVSYIMAVRDKQWHYDDTPTPTSYDIEHPNTINLMYGIRKINEWVRKMPADISLNYEYLVNENYFKSSRLQKLSKDEKVINQLEEKYYNEFY